MRILMISLCTTGVMREQFINYANLFSESNELYCITNNNVNSKDINVNSMLNIEYKRNKPWTYLSIIKLVKILRFINKNKPDIVYVFTPHPVNIVIFPFIRKYKLIYQSHDPIPHMGMSKFDKLIRNIQNYIYNKGANKIIVAGEALKDQILATSKTNPDKIIIIPFAIFGTYINDSIEPSNDQIDLLFFGRIEEYKGLDCLIEALKLIKIKPIVYIAGKGNIYKVFPKIKSIPDNVKLLGYVENEKLISYIKSCKATIFPYYDATGSLVISQSFYYKTPVIASNAGVFPEYVKDGGIIFGIGNVNELAQAIELILTNDKLRNEMSIKAKLICDKYFTMNKVKEMYQELYISLVKENC